MMPKFRSLLTLAAYLLFSVPALADKVVWIFATDLIGAMNNRIAVAERVSPNYKIKDFPLKSESISVEEYMRQELGSRYSDPDAWPDYIFQTEKRVHETEFLLELKRISPKRLVIVHLENPQHRISEFDLVANGIYLPYLEGENIIRPLGVPSWVTPQRLEEEKAKFADRLNWLAPRSPILLVAMGGNSHENPYLPEFAKDLAARLKIFDETFHGSIMIVTSRRTPDFAIDVLNRELRNIDYRIFDWRRDRAKDNFYGAGLSIADAVLVTGDSRSMMSDVLAAGKPLFIHSPAGSTLPEHDRMIQELYRLGLARPFTGASLKSNAYQARNYADEIWNEVRARFMCSGIFNP